MKRVKTILTPRASRGLAAAAILTAAAVSPAEAGGPGGSGPIRRVQAEVPAAPFPSQVTPISPAPAAVPDPVPPVTVTPMPAAPNVSEIYEVAPPAAAAPVVSQPPAAPYSVPAPAATPYQEALPDQPTFLIDPSSCDAVACDDFACDADTCDGCPDDDGCCIEIGGWIQAGYHNESTGLFNDRPDRFNWHQVWLYAEKAADGSDGIGFGGRVDFMYGIDAGDTQAFGNEPGNWDFQNGWDRGASYGFAMPQLYGEVAMGDLSVIAGHFYTLLGYEVVTAPDNFFYSHAFTMYNSEAFTHTGALATYQASDDLTVYAGYTFGWDTGFDQFNLGGQQGSSFLGGFSYAAGEDVTATFITTAGDFGNIGDGYSHSIVIDTALTDKLNYVIQSDILNAEAETVLDRRDAIAAGDAANFSGRGRGETVGVNQYLLYALSDTLGVGGRMEWWKADSDSVYALTGGLNIRTCDNFVLRPEIRYQWDPGADNGILPEDEATIFGIDGVLTF